jgi:hypothetical protein
MMTEQEALVPTMMAEIRHSLRARLGSCDIRAEGGEFVVTHGSKTARADIPHIQNVFVDAFEVAGELEALLTGQA